jgi:hypothetical protein
MTHFQPSHVFAHVLNLQIGVLLLIITLYEQKDATIEGFPMDDLNGREAPELLDSLLRRFARQSEAICLFFVSASFRLPPFTTHCGPSVFK